jgi:hypothetical protein
VDDSQFALLGVVPADGEGAVKEVALRMTVSAREDARFREQLELLAETRGGIYARALADLQDDQRPAAVAS